MRLANTGIVRASFTIPISVLLINSLCSANIQNTIFITNTISLGSEVSSIDDTLTWPKLAFVTLLDARFPNHGWLNALWKSARTCQRTLSLIGNSLYTEISQTFKILLRTSGKTVGKFR